ncbi:hypothetical protein FRC10_003863 [Ceratobasidium sp. 414]|nr:hypothetical protein FRC10_003863 [Ceratobasidium sp. 414]
MFDLGDTGHYQLEGRLSINGAEELVREYDDCDKEYYEVRNKFLASQEVLVGLFNELVLIYVELYHKD